MFAMFFQHPSAITHLLCNQFEVQVTLLGHIKDQ